MNKRYIPIIGGIVFVAIQIILPIVLLAFALWFLGCREEAFALVHPYQCTISSFVHPVFIAMAMMINFLEKVIIYPFLYIAQMFGVLTDNITLFLYGFWFIVYLIIGGLIGAKISSRILSK